MTSTAKSQLHSLDFEVLGLFLQKPKIAMDAKYIQCQII